MGRNIQARKDSEALLRDTSEQLELAIIGADLGRIHSRNPQMAIVGLQHTQF